MIFKKFLPVLITVFLVTLSFSAFAYQKNINCSGGAYTTVDGDEYMADQKYTTSNCAGYIDGNISSTTSSISGTDDQALYQTERWGVSEYKFDLPGGFYNVTLKFAEICFTYEQARVFSVWVEGKKVISDLDIYKQVGFCHALDYTFTVEVKDGQLNIHAQATIDQPKFSAISVKALVTPQPQEISLKEFNLTIDGTWSIAANLSSEDDSFAAQQLQEDLNTKYNLWLSIVNTPAIYGDKFIVLANPAEDGYVQTLCSERELIPDDLLGEEGYLLEVFSDNMIIISSDYPQGVFYGTQSLKQLIKKEGTSVNVIATKIEDWSDNKMRGMHFCGVNFTEASEDYVYDMLDKMAKYKMNMAMFSTECWYNLSQGDNRSKLQDLFNYCRQCHIEPVPEVQSGGVSHTLFREDPHCAEGFWVQDEQFKFVSNVAESVETVNLAEENPSFEIDANGDNVPNGWTFDTSNERDDWSWDNTTSHSGSYSVKVSVPGLSNVKTNQLKSETMEATPNTVYSISFWAKTQGVGGEDKPAAIRVVELDNSDGWIRQHSVEVSSSFWKQDDVSFITSSNCAKIYIYANIWNGYGTAWFDDISLKRMNGALTNVIRTDSSDIVITNLNKTITYEEGKDYNVIDGEMSYPYSSVHTSTRIERVESGDIVGGETVLVSYDFVVNVTGYWWSHPYCISEPRTYNIMFRVLSDIINDEVFKPNYISIGHDEINGINRDSRNKKRNMINAELLAEDINKLNNYIHTIDPDIKMMMWDDMLNPWHNGGKEDYQVQYGGPPGKTSDAIELNLIPTDVIPMIWWYEHCDSKGIMANSPGYYKSKGFDYLVSSWYNEKNIRMWADILRERKDSFGILDTAWHDRWKGLIPSAAYSWSHKAYPIAVASSVEGSGLEAINAIDNNTSTRWSSNFTNNEWIYIDFITPKTFDTVKLNWENAYGKAYEIQISDDATNWTTIYTETNSDGEIDIIGVGEQTARYVKMNGLQRGTGWGYSLWEFEAGYFPPIAFWAMNEGSGSIIYDGTSNHNDGTIYSAEWTQGINGSALSFDGMGDYVEVPDSESLALSNEVAVGAWVRFNQSTSQKATSQYILKKDFAFKLGCEYQSFPNDEFKWVRIGHNATPATDTTSARYGSSSAKFTRTAKGNSSLISRYIDLTGVSSITLHGYNKAENVVRGTYDWERLGWFGRWYDENKNQMSGCPDLGSWEGTFDWTLQERTVTVPEGAKYYRILALGLEQCTGTGWWDDVRITDQNNNVLFYASFENDEVWFKVYNSDPDIGWVGIPVSQTTGQFTHYHGQYDKEFIYIYQDGTEKARLRYNFPLNTSTENMVISEGVNGIIDEVEIYNRALAAEEIFGEYKKYQPIVTASSVEAPGLEAEKAIDNNTSTRWSSKFSDPQWIYIDFKTPKTFSTVTLNWETAYGKAYEIQISDDAVNWTTIHTETSSDGGIDTINLGTQTTKYVRMYGTQRASQYGYSLWEFEVE